jgi:hypothetical protein
MMKLLAAAAIATAMLAWAPPARAADFTFTVPVNVSELPPTIERGKVRCLVTRIGGGVGVTIGDVYSPEFAITGGAYSGVQRVEITAGLRAAEANTYDCSLWFFVRRTDGSTGWRSAYALHIEGAVPEARIMGTDASRPLARTYQAGGTIPGATPP